MKSETVNPWPIIRWSVVTLLFAGTIAIAVDQVKTADGKRAALQSKLDQLQPLIRKQQAEAKEMARLLDEIQEQQKTAKLQLDTLNRLHELQETLRQIELPAAAPAPAPRAPVVQAMVPQPIRTTHQAQPVAFGTTQKSAALWIPPQRHMQAKQIRDRATAKWKQDHSMALYEVEQQTKALETLLEYNKFTANKALLAQVGEKWDPDYPMMVYEFDKQAEALKALNGQ